MSVTLSTIAFMCCEHIGMYQYCYDIILIMIVHTVCYTIIITVAIVEFNASFYAIINYFRFGSFSCIIINSVMTQLLCHVTIVEVMQCIIYAIIIQVQIIDH